jgi:hypothetical protein
MRILTGTLAFVSLGATLCAAEKPCVTVSFDVAETRYKTSLGEGGVNDLKKLVTEWLLRRLDEDVRFLRHQTAPGCDYQLAFQLHRKDPNREGSMHAIAIHATLSGPGVTNHLGQNHEFWIVRDERVADQRVGTASEIFTDIEVSQPPDLAVVLGKPLSQIPITDSGSFVRFDLSESVKIRGWVIPYKPSELCMPPGTNLLISSEVPSPATSEPLGFGLHAKFGGSFKPPEGHRLATEQGSIFCQADPMNQDFGLVDAVGESQVKVKSVHVIEYHSAKTSCERPGSIPPTESGFSGGTP